MSHDKAIKQLCRYIANRVSLIRVRETVGGEKYYAQRYTCQYCPIPKYRGANREECPAAQGKRACSSELIDYFLNEAKR